MKKLFLLTLIFLALVGCNDKDKQRTTKYIYKDTNHTYPLTDPTSVPEPATMLLIALGGGTLIAMKGKK